MITPAAENARRQPLLDEVLDAPVGSIEVFRPDACVKFFPRLPGIAEAAFVERRHVRIKPGDDLDDGEALVAPVGGELLKFLGPLEPFHQAHPPGVAKPEERRAIRVGEMAAVIGHANRPVTEERVGAGVRRDDDFAPDAVQRRVGRIVALGAVAVRAHQRRGVTHAPGFPARPEGRHTQQTSIRRGEDGVECDVLERVGVVLGGLKANLGHAIGLHGGSRQRERQQHSGDQRQHRRDDTQAAFV